MEYALLVLSTVLLVTIVHVAAESYSNQWVLKGDLTKQDIASIARRYGFTFVKQLLDDQYLFEKKDSPKSSKVMARHIAKQIHQEPNIKDVSQQVWQSRSLRQSSFTVSDTQWPYMWYYNGPTADMGVEAAWSQGYNGDNITIAVVDNGVDYNHPDLKDNYVNGTDVYDNDGDPQAAGDDHGTNCAGVAVAVKNNQCVIGAAYKSKFAAIRLIGPSGDTDAGEQSAFTFPEVDIFSCSWGATERSKFDGPKPLARLGLETGIATGRNNLGSIYVFAAGNGGFDDNCNADGYANSVYTIAIAAVSRRLEPPGYGEPCAAALASAYSGPGGSTDNVCTTGLTNSCPCDFTGTSAATPMAAGIFAMVLQANPNLSWRDLQSLVVRTSISTGLTYGEFFTNAVGRQVSDTYGYGLLNVTGLISEALIWTPLDPNHVCISETKTENIQTTSTIRKVNSTIDTDGCNFTSTCVNSLEHVEVRVAFWASLRGAVQLTLKSPLGTSSKLLTRRPRDVARDTSHDWTYMSVQFWDEDPIGNWTLILSLDRDPTESATLISWDVRLHGTGESCTVADVTSTTTPTTTSTTTTTQTTSLYTNTNTDSVDTDDDQCDEISVDNVCSEGGCDILCIILIILGAITFILISICLYIAYKHNICKKMEICGTPPDNNTTYVEEISITGDKVHKNKVDAAKKMGFKNEAMVHDAVDGRTETKEHTKVRDEDRNKTGVVKYKHGDVLKVHGEIGTNAKAGDRNGTTTDLNSIPNKDVPKMPIGGNLQAQKENQRKRSDINNKHSNEDAKMHEEDKTKKQRVVDVSRNGDVIEKMKIKFETGNLQIKAAGTDEFEINEIKPRAAMNETRPQNDGLKDIHGREDSKVLATNGTQKESVKGRRSDVRESNETKNATPLRISLGNHDQNETAFDGIIYMPGKSEKL